MVPKTNQTSAELETELIAKCNERDEVIASFKNDIEALRAKFEEAVAAEAVQPKETPADDSAEEVKE